MAGNHPTVEIVYRNSEETDDVNAVTLDEPLPVRVPPRTFGRTNRISAQNTALTVSADPSGLARQLSYVIIHYSAAPTQTGTIISLVPNNGAAYTTVLSTGSANVQDNIYVPTTALLLLPGDTISVTAPAAGGVITSAVTIAWEFLR